MAAIPNHISPSELDYAALFEAGVSDYFRNFGHRQARERPHQAWLLMSVAKHIPPPHVIAELQVSRRDLRPFADLEDKDSAVNFDFAISRSEIDLRQWRTQLKGSRSDRVNKPQTQKTLEEIAVLAELKMGDSTEYKKISDDFQKLAGAMGYLLDNNYTRFPTCYFILFDPHRRINIDRVNEFSRTSWPQEVPPPKILIGPEPSTMGQPNS